MKVTIGYASAALVLSKLTDVHDASPAGNPVKRLRKLLRLWMQVLA